MIEIDTTILNAIPWVLLILGGLVTIFVRITGDARTEHKELASIRAERITLLETRLSETERLVAELHGKYSALQEFKTSEIADKVVEALIAFPGATNINPAYDAERGGDS